MDGKILGNAHAVGDVNGDGATELLFGSLTGTVAVFKIVGGRLAQWRRCEVDGSITSICVDSSIADDVRICAYVGGGYTQFAQFEIAGEIESLLVLQEASADSDGSPQLLARCISGEVFRVSGSHADGALDKRDIVLWNSAVHDQHDVTFVACNVELGGQRGMSAHASITGLLSLFSSSWERQWDVQVSKASEGFVRVIYWISYLSVCLTPFALAAGSCGNAGARAAGFDSGASAPRIGYFFADGVATDNNRGFAVNECVWLSTALQADKVRQSALFEHMDTPDKRQAIIEKLRSTFPSSASAASTKMPSSPSVEELIRAMLATPVEA
ncbi:hypothetical protein BBJ28_00007670 [Nothophytophthora sp. Chile5]|nr:hypothetical protein BBJ28_00007670 [Nothophytophthora sp. Chile5]